MRLKVKPQFDEGKFVNKRSQQVVFWAARNDSGIPKQTCHSPEGSGGISSKVGNP